MENRLLCLSVAVQGVPADHMVCVSGPSARCPSPFMYAWGDAGILFLYRWPEEQGVDTTLVVNVWKKWKDAWARVFEGDVTFAGLGREPVHSATGKLIGKRAHLSDVENVNTLDVTLTVRVRQPLTADAVARLLSVNPRERLLAPPYESEEEWARAQCSPVWASRIKEWLSYELTRDRHAAWVERTTRTPWTREHQACGLEFDEKLTPMLRRTIFSMLRAEDKPLCAPVFAQALYPPSEDKVAACTDEWLEAAVRCGLALAGGVSEERWVRDPLSFPEVYGQTLSFFACNLPYFTDTLEDGTKTDWFTHAAEFRLPGQGGYDCEDTSAALHHLATCLFYRAIRGEPAKSSLITALYQVTRCYLPLTVDTLSKRGTSWNEHRGGALTAGKYDPSQFMLHQHVRLLPTSLMLRIVSKRKTPESDLAAAALRKVVDTNPLRARLDMLEVLLLESTDHCTSSGWLRDSVAEQVLEVTRGKDEFRTLCDWTVFGREQFYHLLLVGYSSFLMRECGLPHVLFTEAGRVGCQGVVSDMRKYMADKVELWVQPAPEDAELEIAAHFWARRMLPRTLRLSNYGEGPAPVDAVPVRELGKSTVVFALRDPESLVEMLRTRKPGLVCSPPVRIRVAAPDMVVHAIKVSRK